MQAGLAAMIERFTAADIEAAMKPVIGAHMRTLLPECKDITVSVTTMRAADRLLQQQKKAKAIVFSQLTRSWSLA